MELSEAVMATEELEDFSVRTVEGNTERWLDEKGHLHREDGPAYIDSNGFGTWFKHGRLHRDGGPAWSDFVSEGWMINGSYHREDGPAYIEQNTNMKVWRLNGRVVTEAEVRALGKMK